MGQKKAKSSYEKAKEVFEMSHATICPICNGNGRIKEGRKQTQPTSYPSTTGEEICYGCGGRGWVEVSDN